MLYEYSCKCGNYFEARKPISQRASAECPKCGQIAEKKLSIINFTFGWNRSILLQPGVKDELVKDV